MRRRFPARPEVKRNSDTRLAPPLARRALVAIEAPASPLSQTTWQRRAQWLRNHPLVIILETAGLVGLIFAVGLFVYELRERQDERIARAWQLLTTPAPGNSGKREALEYLNNRYACFGSWCWKERTSLVGLDLSATTHRQTVYLAGLSASGADLTRANMAGTELLNANLSRATLHRANLSGAEGRWMDVTHAIGRRANMSGAKLQGANFTDAAFFIADMSGAVFREATMIRANLRNSNFTGANLSSTNLSEANLTRANLTSANLLDAELSDADLAQVRINAQTVFVGTWAWADRPPKNMPPELAAAITYRDPAERREP